MMDPLMVGFQRQTKRKPPIFHLLLLFQFSLAGFKGNRFHYWIYVFFTGLKQMDFTVQSLARFVWDWSGLLQGT